MNRFIITGTTSDFKVALENDPQKVVEVKKRDNRYWASFQSSPKMNPVESSGSYSMETIIDWSLNILGLYQNRIGE